MSSVSRMSVVTLAALVLAGLAVPAMASELVAYNGRWVTAEEAAQLAASDPAPVAGDPSDWGGSATTIFAIGACGAGSRDTTHTYQATNCQRVEPIASVTTTAVGFPVHLPTGALITSARMHYFDNIAGEPSVGFYQVTNTGGLNLVTGLTPGAFAGGNATFTAAVSPAHQVVNAGSGYQVLAILNRAAGGNHGIYAIEVSYRLQVSPAPAVASFPNDVPTGHPFFRFIEAMAASGITGGCGAGSYCPDSPVTRGQMAVFVATALGLHFPN